MPITKRNAFILKILWVDFVVQIEELVVAVDVGVLEQFVVVRFRDDVLLVAIADNTIEHFTGNNHRLDVVLRHACVLELVDTYNTVIFSEFRSCHIEIHKVEILVVEVNETEPDAALFEFVLVDDHNIVVQLIGIVIEERHVE